MQLCLLHGFAQPASAWADVADALAGLELALDLRLCPTPGHDPALAVAADWDGAIAALATRVPAHAVAVGYSFGARLALGLLAHGAVAGAILIGVNPGLAEPAARAVRHAADARWAARLRALGTAGFLDEWEAQPLFATQARAPRARRQRRRAARSALAPEPLAQALERLGLGAMPDLAPVLAARADHAHLLVGADDVRFRALAAAARARAPALGLDVIPASGHDPTLEAPAALAAAIARAAIGLRPALGRPPRG